MVTIYDVEPGELIEQTAEELKKIEEIKPPVWATFVKTGAHKERPPIRSDWWYTRAASILRTLYKKGPIGVSKLRTRYGGKKKRGHKPEEFRKGSGNILRKLMQQLEKAGLVKQIEKGVHKGRVITPKGRSMLDKIATRIKKSGKQAAKKEPKEQETRKEEEKKEIKESRPKEDKKGVKKPTAEELIKEVSKAEEAAEK